MKHKSIILSCVMIFCLAVSANAAYNITLETTDGNTASTEFAAGADLYLNINLDADHDGVAGCAFTLIYPSDLLTAPDTNPSNLPDSPSSADITSIFPFTIKKTGEYTRCENSAEAGKIMFAGAEVTENEGGAKTHPYDVTLFTVKFTVKSTASGTATFELMQTTLTNPDAGWNGEGVPVIVGAVPNTDAAFGGDLSDDFPIMLQNFATNPTVTVTLGDCGPGTYCKWKADNDYDGTGSTPDIGGEEDDYDQDGYSNLDEMKNGTDPYVDNAPGDDGYTSCTDFDVTNLDVDGNGTSELGTDGVLLIRYMFGYRGNDLIDSAIGSGNPSRDTAALIEAYLAKAGDCGVYDVDKSGTPTLGEDGVMILRYMFGYRGDDLIEGSVNEYCERCEAFEIEEYIQKLFSE
jgi:hypothetical protein